MPYRKLTNHISASFGRKYLPKNPENYIQTPLGLKCPQPNQEIKNQTTRNRNLVKNL